MHLSKNKFKVSSNAVFTTLANDTVILDQELGTYYSLNEVGTHVWEILEKSPTTFDTLKTNIMENFEIDEVTCTNDLTTLLSELLHEKLLEEVL